MKQGYTYILSNESMPGLLKVGFTTNDPKKRAAELFTTGVPTPFKVEFVLISDDAPESERIFHEEYAEHRTPGREFFKMDIDAAMQGLFRITNYDFEMRYADEVTDPGHHARYSDMADVHPFNLMNLLEGLREDEWKILAARYQEKLDKITAKRTQKQS